MFNYTSINSKKFEELALLYLQQQYPGSTWEPTKKSWDGNKDIQCKYTFFDQTMEYWAEAKFTPNPNKRNLQKSQLDPTLVSAFLNRNPVTINFISNNNISENYAYRLTDFTLKTNIGITLVLKDEFERWLLANPEICKKYNLLKNDIACSEVEFEEHAIKQCVITEKDSESIQYSFTKSLNCQTVYFLYVNIYSTTSYDNCTLESDVFRFINSSSLLTNPDGFRINKGWNGYKFEFAANELFFGDVCLTVKQNNRMLMQYKISDLRVVEDHTLIMSYAKQEKALIDIANFIRESGNENNIVQINGVGATGKSHLLKQIRENAESHYDVFYLKFDHNTSYNAECLCRFLIYLNLGKIWEFDLELVSEELKKNINPKQCLLYENLISGLEGNAEEVVDYLYKQMSYAEFDILYPTSPSVRKLAIMDDIHKLTGKHLKVIEHVLSKYVLYNNSYTLILASRGHVISNLQDFSNKLYSIELCGLSKEDKDTTLEFYLNDEFNITYNRATDDVLIFSNIVQSLIREQTDTESITKSVRVVKEMTNPQITNLNIYKTILKEYAKYNPLIELVYYLNTDMPLEIICTYFDEKEIDYLVQEHIFKKIRGCIYPFHDLLVQAFFEINSISHNTIKIVNDLVKIDSSKSVYYFSLIINSQYGYDFLPDARKMRDSYYENGDLFPAYQIAKGIVGFINLEEEKTAEEIRDIFVLAETSMYEKDHEEILKSYDLVIKYGKKYLKRDSILAGLVLRASIEKVNIQFWDFQTKNILNNIDHIQTVLSDISFKTKDIDFVYLHCINRSMVTQLLLNQKDEAKKLFDFYITEASKLNYKAHIGFSYMDFGRGSYSFDLKQSIYWLEKAVEIFISIGSELRREMECEAELLFAKCMSSQSQETMIQLEELSDLLFRKHYFELYAKVKLKLAALKIVYDLSDSQNIQEDIFQAEYAMKYTPSVRYTLILLSVKSVYYFKIKDFNTARKLNNECMKMSKKIGDHYQKIYEWNNRNMPRQKIRFMLDDNFEPFAYYLTPYLW